jgi:hypothetical protein
MSNQNVLYEITTKIEKEDYRRFKYLTIFRKKAKTVWLIILMAAVGAGLAAMIEGSFSLPKFLLIWLILIPTEFAAIFLGVEYKAFKRTSLVRVGLAIVKQSISFYENYLTAEDNISKGTKKIKYDNLYQALETKDYYIIYTSADNPSMIRKIDIDGDDRDGFHKFLQTKMGTRYKNLIK